MRMLVSIGTMDSVGGASGVSLFYCLCIFLLQLPTGEFKLFKEGFSCAMQIYETGMKIVQT